MIDKTLEENCFGIIPIRKKEQSLYQVFIIQAKNGGYWGFPKGHSDHPNEIPKEVAIRELKEETNLSVDKFLDFSYIEKYQVIINGNVFLQQEEIIEGDWFSFDEALKKITFDSSKESFSHLIKDLTL